MIVLGVDPGLNLTGYAVLDYTGTEFYLVEAGVIRTKARDPLERRLNKLYAGITEIIDEFSPDVLAVEDLYSHYRHPKTAVIMGHARGVYFLAAGNASIPVCSYPATRIKKSLTGAGRANKEQVSRMIARAVSCDMSNVPNDATDAIATALCHINAVSHGSLL